MKASKRLAAAEKPRDRRAAVAGDVWHPSGVCKLHYSTPTVVKPKSEGQRGQWLCLSCSHACENQIDKDNHCAKPVKRGGPDVMPNPEQPAARHVLAWRSFDTGDLEAP